MATKLEKAKPSKGNALPKNFVNSNFSLRIKLISIISLIILSATGGMIFFASQTFSNETEVRIQESNLNLVQSTQEWIETELKYIQYAVRTAATSRKAKASTTTFFKENPEFLYVGITNSGDAFSQEFYNHSLMQIRKIKTANIKGLHPTSRPYIRSALQGKFTVFNASTSKQAILGICQKLGKSVLLLYMLPTRIQNVFEAQKHSVSIYMVNDKGEVIVHPNSNIVLARSNFLTKGIVKKMWQNPVLSGQSRYTDTQNKKVYLASYKKLRVGSLGLIAEVEEDIVFEPVRRIRNRNLVIMCIFLILAITVVYFFAKLITVPVLSLVKATTQIEQGNYNIEIKSVSNDEIGRLTHSFTSMAKGLGEREKIKDAFGKFVNKEIAEQALNGEIKLGGEERDAAIFFSDLRNFTAMSEQMSAEDVVAFLNQYFTQMVGCITNTHGVVDKYIGDAIMAHWGALQTKGNETENAIDAALLMRQALVKFNDEGKGQRPVAKIGCGINTGKVISGQIGSNDRLEFTVIGDAVNLASRIETLNKPFGSDILISAEAYERVKGIFKVEAMPTVRVKGKAQAQIFYAVIGRIDDPLCLEDMNEVRKFVGIDFDPSILQRAKLQKIKLQRIKFQRIKVPRDANESEKNLEVHRDPSISCRKIKI